MIFLHSFLKKINEKESSKNTGEQEFQCTDALNGNTLNTQNNNIIKCIEWIVIYYANKSKSTPKKDKNTGDKIAVKYKLDC